MRPHQYSPLKMNGVEQEGKVDSRWLSKSSRKFVALEARLKKILACSSRVCIHSGFFEVVNGGLLVLFDFS